MFVCLCKIESKERCNSTRFNVFGKEFTQYHSLTKLTFFQNKITAATEFTTLNFKHKQFLLFLLIYNYILTIVYPQKMARWRLFFFELLTIDWQNISQMKRVKQFGCRERERKYVFVCDTQVGTITHSYWTTTTGMPYTIRFFCNQRQSSVKCFSVHG